MRIQFHKKFQKELKKAPVEIQKAAAIRLDLFVSNPIHPLLRNHLLTGTYIGYRSISITGDWRAIYKEVHPLIDEPIAVFVYLGTHSKLYK